MLGRKYVNRRKSNCKVVYVQNSKNLVMNPGWWEILIEKTLTHMHGGSAGRRNRNMSGGGRQSYLRHTDNMRFTGMGNYPDWWAGRWGSMCSDLVTSENQDWEDDWDFSVAFLGKGIKVSEEDHNSERHILNKYNRCVCVEREENLGSERATEEGFGYSGCGGEDLLTCKNLHSSVSGKAHFLAVTEVY